MGAFWRIALRMARPKKRPVLTHCKVTATTNPRAPYRVWFPKSVDGGAARRVFKSFANEDRAWLFAEEQDKEIAAHGLRFGDITGEARRAFDHYRDQAMALDGIGLTLPSFETLVATAITDYRKSHEAASSITIAEGLEQFLAYKKSRVGDRQNRTLKSFLTRFAKDFGDRPFPAVTAAEIVGWLDGLKPLNKHPKAGALLSPTARNNHRNVLSTLFAYAAAPARAWCHHNPLSDVQPEKIVTHEPRAYSVAAVATLMQTALVSKPELLPMLVLGMFCGLRVSEAAQIDLAQLTTDTDEFRATGKTGMRLAPLTDAAKAWLGSQVRRTGKAWLGNEGEFYESMRSLFALSGVDAIDNGARHTFISYRCADTRDVAKVADECGNSATKIKNHYRKLVTEAAAKEFFALRPATKANVTSIVEGRVA